MHTPFSGLVRACHRKMMREFTNATVQQIEDDFARRVLPSLTYPSLVGNLCSGSVYLALSSIIDSAKLNGTYRVGLFSYGSGCSSEFFSGLIDRNSASVLGAMRIGTHLENRCELTFEEYSQLLDENLRCLVPEKNKKVNIGQQSNILRRVKDRREMLVMKEIKDYHREYEWL